MVPFMYCLLPPQHIALSSVLLAWEKALCTFVSADRTVSSIFCVKKVRRYAFQYAFCILSHFDSDYPRSLETVGPPWWSYKKNTPKLVECVTLLFLREPRNIQKHFMTASILSTLMLNVGLNPISFLWSLCSLIVW